MLARATIDPLTDARWQRFVEGSADASVFHHREWLALLHDQYRYPMLAECVIDGEGEIVAGLPLAHVRSRLTGSRLVALPFSDSCPPLVRERGEAQAHALLLAALRDRYARERTAIEVRSGVDGLGEQDGGFCQHEIALDPDLDAVRSRFNTSTRRGVSRARNKGVEVTRAVDGDALSTFYQLHLQTRRSKGVPTQPWRFIARLQRLFDAGLGFVLIARFEERPVAAAVFLLFNGVLTSKYSASEDAAKRLRPNNAIFMEAIRWGCENGVSALYMGRSEMYHEGLREFKRGFGAQESPLSYTRLSAQPSQPGRAGVPRPLRLLISRTPPVTGRLVGAALYRHFG